MTITYSQEVAEVKFLGFGKLLFKWKGSVYKLFWRELLTWIVIFYAFAFLNNLVLSKYPNLRGVFEDFCVEVNEFSNYVPLSFILGFFVSILIGRWWNQYLNIPWPDRNMLCISLYLRHHVDDKDLDGSECKKKECKKCKQAVSYRRKLVRWLNLAAILTFRDVAASVKQRFPTMEHVSSAGFMTESERETYESIETTQLKYWIPFTWYINTLHRARKQGLIASDITLDRLVDEMNAYRGNCGMLQSYDWICIPLVYTQVVCVAVYGYFVLALFGRQRILGQTELSSQLESNTSMVSDSDEHLFAFLIHTFPIHTLLEFFFYMGWMKVAEQLINPFGMDDEDYEVNMIIDRNLEVSFLAVDTLHDEGPADADDEDIWVGKTFAEAPYTEEALEHKKDPFLGSTANIGVSRNADFVPLESVLDLQADSGVGGSRAHLLPTESNHLMSKLSIRSRGSEKNSHRRRLLSSAESDKSDYSESFIGSSRIINPYRERGGPNEFTHQHSFRKDRHVDRFGSARSESDSHVDEHEFQASASREAMHLEIKSEKQSSNTDSAVGSPVEPVSNRVVTLCDGKTKVVPAPAIITTVPNNPNDPVNSTGDVVLSRNLAAVEEQPEVSSQPSIEELEPEKMSPIQNSWRVS